MSDNNTNDNKKEDKKQDNGENKVKEVVKEEKEEFFDANDHFVENVDQIKEKIKGKKSDQIKSETSSDWLGIRSALNSVTNRLSGQKPDENKIKEMIISIKDETKRELQMKEELNEELKKGTDPNFKTNKEDKTTKLHIISDEKTAENENKTLEVTVINEDDIQINSDDIEMSPMNSIKFLINLIAALILDLFIISGVCHWIYIHLDGLDWDFKGRTHFNFHIFFMTLGICGFGFGILVHRIFRGWSSGALSFLHTTITLTTLIFFVIGITAAIVSLNHLNAVHFYSVHSWLGLLSMLSFTLLWLSAIVIFVFPRFIYDIQRIHIPVHNFFGRAVFTLVCGTAVVGFSDKLRVTDEDMSVGPIGRVMGSNDSNSNSSDSYEFDLIETTTYERIVDDKWKMPEEALLLLIISTALLFYTVLVNYLSSNDVFRRRLLPEEQGIEIKTRIRNDFK